MSEFLCGICRDSDRPITIPEGEDAPPPGSFLTHGECMRGQAPETPEPKFTYRLEVTLHKRPADWREGDPWEWDDPVHGTLMFVGAATTEGLSFDLPTRTRLFDALSEKVNLLASNPDLADAE